MRYVVGLLGFVVIALGLGVVLDVRGTGTRYLAFIDRTANAPGSLMPRSLRRITDPRSPRLRLIAGAGLLLVGAVTW
jgi:hypothetical protein